ncbi:LutC/YkgG family protein [Azospirillum thermophilum]|uniref:Lactate utilization protein n=1 Tax=Azospirillum thermophilum TaxID=2202148 RepID=A0A2S2CNE8_9PROT|nr:LUD domain-containing protein [Azospirillum thermophilum]AWK85900.1 lactate utilization protein [Azospirillum thermophilum]
MTGGNSARAQMLAGIRKALGPGGGADARAAVAERLSRHPRNLVPARGQLPQDQQVELFAGMAAEVAATVERLPALADVPAAVASYLAGLNLPAEIRVAPDPELDSVPWAERPTLTVSRGAARDGDGASVTGAFAAIAETGTLMLASGDGHPTTLNFLPDTHIVVLRKGKVVGTYEEAWDRLRAAAGGFATGMPRTVNFVTGPSRTGDIEQKIELGAHGPRRLHILLVEE